MRNRLAWLVPPWGGVRFRKVSERLRCQGVNCFLRRLLVDFFDPREEKPLIGVGVELFVNEDAIAFALSFPLEWQGYQVAESAFRNSRLSWEHAVVGIELDRFGAPHCFGDECASEVAGKLRAYRAVEEEPDMATVSRSRAFYAGLQAAGFRNRADGGDGVLPTVLVEVHDKDRSG